MVGPRLVQCPQHRGKSRPPGAVVIRGEIAAGVERLQIGGEKDIVGPTAVAGHKLPGQHVDTVEIWALFAVDFDIDEPLVHQLGDLRI